MVFTTAIRYAELDRKFFGSSFLRMGRFLCRLGHSSLESLVAVIERGDSIEVERE